MQSPQLQALAASHPEQLAPHLALLRLFSYGDYETYEATPGLPALSDAQRLKLRQLSLLSLAAASRQRADLSYARLLQRLRLDTTPQLETLVTTAIYAGLIDAKLDPARQRVHVVRVAPLRDLSPDNDTPRMRAALQGWSDRCAAILTDVETHMERVRQGAAERARAESEAKEKMAEKMAKAMTELRDADKFGGGGIMREQLARRGMSKRAVLDAVAKSKADEAMDLDGLSPSEESKKRAGKRKM